MIKEIFHLEKKMKKNFAECDKCGSSEIEIFGEALASMVQCKKCKIFLMTVGYGNVYKMWNEGLRGAITHFVERGTTESVIEDYKNSLLPESGL